MAPYLVVDCYLEPPGASAWFVGLLGDRPVQVVRAPDHPLDPDPRGYTGIVVTGSAASIPEPPPWLGGLVDLLSRALRDDVPVLGSCFGHQALAVAAAGPEAVFKRPLPEVGWPEIRVDARDPVVGALGPRFRTFVSHEDEVRPSPGLEILASSASCPVHALRVAGRRAWGVQFHVEYDRPEEERIVRWRADRHPELALDPDAALADAVDAAPLGQRLFAAFTAAAEAP